MSILNIAGYKFITLSELTGLRAEFYKNCEEWQLKGTILLSPEGINLSLAGTQEKIASFKNFLQQDARFQGMTFRESLSQEQPFRRLKIKLKKEIITMRQPQVRPEMERAAAISPQELKQWLDENRDFTLLDTRNDYEVQFGTFRGATNPKIKDFCEFPEATKNISRAKPIVMFCTGGIRCEKAGLYMSQSGFSNVFQLEGGILNYFAETGGAHYEGDCFVFDGRVALDTQLKESGALQCTKCQGPKKTSLNCPTCN